MIDLVGQDEEAALLGKGNQPLTPFLRQRVPAGILKSRNNVQKLRAMRLEGLFQNLDHETCFIGLDGNDAQSMVRKDAQGQEVGRFLDKHRIARPREKRAKQIQSRGNAGRDEQALWLNRETITLGQKIRQRQADRKSTRLNSSHQLISYAVFC